MTRRPSYRAIAELCRRSLSSATPLGQDIQLRPYAPPILVADCFPTLHRPPEVPARALDVLGASSANMACSSRFCSVSCTTI